MKSFPMHLIRGGYAVLVAALLSCACDDSSGGPDVQSMTLEIENEAGRVDVSCIALPVLIGSISAQAIEVAPDLTVTTKATNREVSLSYTGTTPFEKTYELEDISYQDWPLSADSVASGDSETYLITLSLGCNGSSSSP